MINETAEVVDRGSTLDERTPVSIAREGWTVCSVGDESLPSEVRIRCDEFRYRRPITKLQRRKVWDDLHRLIIRYSKRLSDQYGTDVEDVYQQSYLFFEELLDKFQPLYRYYVPPSCELPPIKNKNHPPIITDTEDGGRYVWRFYELKPYLCFSMYQKIRYYVQRTKSHSSRYLTFGAHVCDDGDTWLETLMSMSATISLDIRDPEEIAQTESLMLNLSRDIARALRYAPKAEKEVGTLFFIDRHTVKEIESETGRTSREINKILQRVRVYLKRREILVGHWIT